MILPHLSNFMTKQIFSLINIESIKLGGKKFSIERGTHLEVTIEQRAF